MNDDCVSTHGRREQAMFTGDCDVEGILTSALSCGDCVLVPS